MILITTTPFNDVAIIVLSYLPLQTGNPTILNIFLVSYNYEKAKQGDGDLSVHLDLYLF